MDKKLSRWPLVFALTLSATLLAQKRPDPNWTLTFGEEFNGAALDLSRWVPHSPWGAMQGSEVLKLSGGQLHLGAQGVISTFGLFAQTYGRFEIRCRIPSGTGLKPSFRLFPIPLGTLPVIQVFEGSGAKIAFANRWGTEQTERSFGDSFSAAGLATGLHTIAVEWESDHISWLVDDKEKFRSEDGIPHQPMYILIDLAGGETSPATFDIDYIHVYKRAG